MKVWGDCGEDTVIVRRGFDPLKATLATAASAVLAVAFLLGVMVGLALAAEDGHHMHGGKAADADWYEYDCCDNRDCALVKDQEVRIVGDKYVWTSRFGPELFINMRSSNVRPSRDGRWHSCEVPSSIEGARVTAGYARCLYVPLSM